VKNGGEDSLRKKIYNVKSLIKVFDLLVVVVVGEWLWRRGYVAGGGG
jgi:hypothetical protein